MRFLRGLLFQIVLWSIVPLVVITAVSVVSIYEHQQTTRELVADRAARLAQMAATRLSHMLAEHTSVLQTLADAEENHPDDRLAQQQVLEQSEGVQALFDHGVALPHPAGVAVARSQGADRWLSQAPVARLQAQVAATGRPAFATLYPDQASGEGLILLAVPVPSPVEGPRPELVEGPDPSIAKGVLVGAFSPVHLGIDEMLAGLQIGRQGIGYVVDSRGQIIYHPQAEEVGRIASHLPGVEQVKQTQAGALFYTETDGEEWIAGYAPVPDLDWGVIVQQPWREIVTPIMQLSIIPPALAILAALVSLVAVYLLVCYVIRPLRRLNQMAGQVAWGDFAATEEPVGGVQEIRDLHVTLKQMAGQIQRYQAGMHSYIAAVTQGQEEERKRLARELHDDTAQALVGLIQRIKLTRRDLERAPARATERLSELETLATTAWQDVRRFSEDLRPSYLEQLGLVPAVTTLAEQMCHRGGPAVSLAVSGSEQRLSPELELAVFRIVQEGLNNVRQHAQAEQASVELSFTEDGLTVSIQDDGIGFEPPERPYDLAQQGHVGLAGMRERALLVGGYLTVDSTPGRGTRVVAFVPYLQPG